MPTAAPSRINPLSTLSTVFLFFAATTLSMPTQAFEGILNVRVAAGGKTNVSEFFLRENGDLRADVSVSDPVTGTTLRNTILVRAEKPTGMAHVLHNTRQWERHTLSAGRLEKERYLVEEMEKSKILGRQVRHVLLTDTQSGDVLEMWLDAKMSNLNLVDRILRKAVHYAASVSAVLDDKGIRGFPLKLHYTKKSNGNKLLFEVFRITPKKLEQKLWAVPRGYSQGALPGSPFSSSSDRKKKHDPLSDASKKLQGLFGR
ncbi:MAG: DUF4412 domain-containing protein [Deltaproteobacteria bacterium]|nr:DUF4412 domain-containing protein [Deltaproteobacteria bacterium]